MSNMVDDAVAQKSFSDVVDFFGSEASLAKALRVKRQAVNQWDGVIPEGRAYQIQVITNGAITAEDLLGSDVHTANDPEFDPQEKHPIG